MGYSKTDELAINTIRTLAVRRCSFAYPTMTELPPLHYRWVFLNDAPATKPSQLLTAFCFLG
jgi:hypothetical protein